MTLKKALVAITVVAMLFGMVGTAFAATSFPDITDSKTAAAATRLNALGIVTGYPDGNFGVKDSVTRAQFAAIAVRALGLESAANFAKGATKFSDVAADYWASGYINVASQQGLIAGYPDGKFGPEDPVTYAQALTIIVRMLGYAPVTEGRGIWPANYLAKAAQIGVSSGVAISGGGSAPATRGDVALFVDNSLTIDLMVEDGVTNGQITYKIAEGKNLLNTALGATAYEGTLTSVPGLDGSLDATITVATADGDEVLDLGSVDVARLLGHKVKAWTGKDGSVFFVEDKTPSTSIKTGTVVDTSPADGITDGISVTDDNVKVTLPAETTYVRNFATEGGVSAFEAGDEIAVIYDGRSVSYVVGIGYETGLVDKTSSTYTRVYFENGKSITLDGESVTYSGAATKFEDIKAGDVVQYAKISATDNSYLVVVTRNAKKGELTKITSSSFYIDGTAYKAADQSAEADGAKLDPNDFDSSLGETTTVYLNKDGKVVAVDAAAAPTKAYALLTAEAPLVVTTTDGQVMYVKVLKSDGTKATLKIANKADVDGNTVDYDAGFASAQAALTNKAGTVIGYTVDSDGAIDEISLYADVDSPTTYNVKKDNHTLQDTVTNAVYALGSSTPIFQESADGTSFAVLTRAELEAAKDGSTVSAAITLKTDSIVVGTIVVKGDIAAATDKVGIVSGRYRTADGYFVSVISEGASKDYEVASGDYDDLAVGDVISFFADGTEISNLSEFADPAPITVDSVDATNLVVYPTTGDPVTATEDTQVFDYTGSTPGATEFANISTDNSVKVYVDGDGIVVAIVIVE
ncbi:MAG: S-layer homology domain-containing protein [Bacillota bacterium]